MGTCLSERQWGTVREDYSQSGNARESFPHDHLRSRTYRWGEDGLAGFSDDKQNLCFALALWNGRDPILKERLFGLTNSEGNHGEDVKEYYFYLDSTPTHSYMKYLYKYPQRAFPYDNIVANIRYRNRNEFEYERHLDAGQWEYPWYAAWDLAFLTIALAMVDIEFAKKQLLMILDTTELESVLRSTIVPEFGGRTIPFAGFIG